MFPYELLSLCGLAGLAALLVVPILAFIKVVKAGRRITDLESRVWHLQRQLEQLPAAAAQPPPIPAFAPEPSLAELQDVPPHRAAVAPPPIPKAPKALDLEAWLGGRALGWVAVVLMLLAAAFFLKELYDRDFIGPLGRVTIALTFGLAFCIAGRQFYVRGWTLFSQMLTAAGVVILYLAVYATFGYYDMLDQNGAGIFLVVLVAGTFGLALVYDAPAIAIMAVVGALVNPILLHSDQDRYVSLFTYLGVFNAAVVVLLLMRRWPFVSLVTLVGTQIVFWSWYSLSYHPEKRTACLLFQGTLFVLWLIHHLRGPLHRFAASLPEDWVRWLVQSLALAVSGYMLLWDDFREWLGSMALGMAILYALLLRYALGRRPADGPQLAILLAIAMGFVAIVFPLEARTEWIGVGWAVQGLALWWFSARVWTPLIRVMAAALLGLGWGTWLFVQTLGGYGFPKMMPHEAPFVPFLNKYGLPSLTIAACLLAAALLARRTRSALGSLNFVTGRVAGLVGIFSLWVLCSVEAYDFFLVRTMRPREHLLDAREREFDAPRQQFLEGQRVQQMVRAGRVALSVTWGLFAMGLVTLGLRLPSRPLRWMGLALFGVTLLKVLFVDTENLRGMYRVAAFFVLALLMGAAAWAYQRLKGVWMADETETSDAEPI